MWTLGSLSFLAPWALAAAVLLPLLWWLLRAIPPAPRRLAFPAIRLVFGLATAERAAARTPWWLIALRLLLSTAIILAVAHPVLDAHTDPFDGPLLLVVDDGWAAAKNWPERHALIETLLNRADRAGQAVAVATTAPPPGGDRMAPPRLMTAAEARPLALSLEPHPWPTDRAEAARVLRGLPHDRPYQVVWIADGLADGSDFAAALRRLGPLSVRMAPAASVAKVLLPPSSDGADLLAAVRRLDAAAPETVSVQAMDGAGRVLLKRDLAFDAGVAGAQARFSMPTELRNRIARFAIAGEDTAGAVALVDESLRRRPVGLVDDNPAGGGVPLLDDLFYAERALEPQSEVRRGRGVDLVKRDLSLAVVPDTGELPADEIVALRRWVEGGGVLVRFAGPKLARNPDTLLPVRLLGSGRTLGGAMSWTRAMSVAPMPGSGPFAGLQVPPDLKVYAQVLAEPSIDLNEKTWARLEDGTPLVTGAPLGKGWLVLIHTTVGPGWSNLGLSGLFPDMLGRLLNLGHGIAGAAPRHPLAPIEVLDGFGRLSPPSGAVETLRLGRDAPSPRHPPGLYGGAEGHFAFNLGPAVAKLAPLDLPAGVRQQPLGSEQPEHDLQPWLLMASLALLIADLVALLAVRGQFRRGAAAAGIVLAVLLSWPADSHAAANAATEAMAEQASLKTRLAYVLTGDARVDAVSRAGLEGLTAVLSRRTTAELGEPMGVNIETGPLAVFPLLYWPVTGTTPPLSQAGRDRVNQFMRHGGMVVFDTKEGGGTVSERLAALTVGLDIPPLTVVTEDHVLTRSFYLLKSEPGRLASGPVYVQNGGDPANDNVSPVVIGGNDWAGAWAIDRSGRPIYAVVPGGERQREMAYRFGVNLVMYALTGSYKADQVHLPAILERLRR